MGVGFLVRWLLIVVSVVIRVVGVGAVVLGIGVVVVGVHGGVVMLHLVAVVGVVGIAGVVAVVIIMTPHLIIPMLMHGRIIRRIFLINIIHIRVI